MGSSLSSSPPIYTMTSSPSYITCQELHRMLYEADPATKSSTLVIDVRDDDREEGWIPDSYNWPTSELRSGGTKANAELMDAFVKKQYETHGKSVLVWHCMFSQMRGPWAAKRALEAVARNSNLNGKVRILIMQGGFVEWRRCFPDLVKKERCVITGGLRKLIKVFDSFFSHS